MENKNFDDLKLKIEAILFSYGDYISPKEIMQVLELDSENIVKSILNELKQKFDNTFSFEIEENDNGKWKMTLRNNYEQLVSDLISGLELPPSALKVLAIIAYEQPVTKTRLSEILGKAVKSEVNYLYKNKFLSYEKRGIGKYYRVTKKFFDYFKLEEDEDFRQTANKTIKTFLEEPLPLEVQKPKKDKSLKKLDEFDNSLDNEDDEETFEDNINLDKK